jgi:PhoH-like ATPase
MADLRTYVLDTNVLIHDPTALFRFAEHAIFVPMVVLEELDSVKNGVSEIAANARQASRFLDTIIADADVRTIAAGLPLPAHAPGGEADPPCGRLFLQTAALVTDKTLEILGHSADNSILASAVALAADAPADSVVVVSKDINLRIKARIVGISAEDYYNDKVLDDIDLLYSGLSLVDSDFRDHCTPLRDAQDARFCVPGDELPDVSPNECLYLEGTDNEAQEFIVCGERDGDWTVRPALDFRSSGTAVWGIHARNMQQNFALNVLMDPDIEFVSLVGVAGTGKTLLALAAGLTQCLDMRRYKEIVVTRATIPVGEDIGFLPGSEEEKMTPWMGALMDNLEVLSEPEGSGEWGRAATTDLLQQRIKIRSLNFMRGRTFLNRLVILDEAQNLTAKQMKTLITRAGPGSKFICLGNIAQIDTPYLSETTSGLTYVVDRFRNWPHSAHITLQHGERSRLADFATQHL